MNKISVTGFAPDNINYCPECGAMCFPYATCHSDGSMECDQCGLICYIVEHEDSHRKEDDQQ
jgi:hypothetical protein